MTEHIVNIRNSIATRLMTVVFSFYVIVAISMTLLHMFIEYNYQKSDVNRLLVEFQPSIQSTIAMNIWHMDDLSLSDTMESILKIPIIAGIRVEDETGIIIAAQGEVKFDGEYKAIEKQISFLGLRTLKEGEKVSGKLSFETFKHEFPVIYQHGGTKRVLGKVTLYSNSTVIFDRVKVEFILLVVNAIIKTIVLWFFFLFVSNKLLRKPLSIIADTAEKVDLENLNDIRISISSSEGDELKIIEKSFNSMIQNLSDSMQKQKDAQNQIVEQKNRFEALVDNIPGVTYRSQYEKISPMVFISDEIFKLSGYHASDFMNNIRSYSSIIYIEDSEMVQKTVENSISRKSGFNIEYRIVRADGTLEWVNERGKCILDDDGNVLYIDGVIIDINEQKQAEVEIRKLRKYLANVIDSMPSSLVGVDSQMRITQWNKTIADETGVPEKQALGKEFKNLLPQFENELHNISESIKTRAIKSCATKKRLDGEDAKFEDITIYPLIANGVQGAVIRIDDVTKKVQIEEILVQSEKMLSVGGLAAGMAHEVNNPLAGMLQTINVMSNRLIEKPDMPANVKAAEQAGTTTETIAKYMQLRDIPRMVNTITTAGNRAATIISNMLSFARKGGSEKMKVDLNELTENTIELALTDYNFKGDYDFKKITITKDLSSEPMDICCDQSQIQQVVLNLLRNAAQAMREASISKQNITIRTSSDSKSGMVTLEIEDNGPGMDSETAKRVFEPFFTTKSVGMGTGLGLSISYFIVTENHSGSMYVSSEQGSGTKFTIKLPIECT